MHNLIGTYTLTPLDINLTRPTEKCSNQLSRRHCDVPEPESTQDIGKYADFIVTALSTAVDKTIPTSKSGRSESKPDSEESLALIKEKRRLSRQYSQAHDPLVKRRINQLQKEIKNKLMTESQASWEQF